MSENLFPLFHTYRRLADEGKAEWFNCLCGNSLVTRLGKDDNLVLWCAACDIKIVPGFNMIDKVRKVIKENQQHNDSI